MLTASEKIKIIIKRKNMTLGDLADLLGISRQNLSNKITRNNFAEKDLQKIAAALGAEFVCSFKFPDGTEI